MSVMWVIVLRPSTKFEVRRPSPFRRYGQIFGHGFELRVDRDLRPFDLQMGARVTRVMDFIPANFEFSTPFRP